MGYASTYFFDSNNSDKQTLHRRITPSNSQFEKQQSRWNDLADFVRPKLRELTDLPIRTWLQGSYKFGTQIRPVHKGDEFDIDLGVYFCWEGDPTDGEYQPAELKDLVQSALLEFSSTNDDVFNVTPPKKRCCRIKFRNDFHIDVPCYHLDVECDTRSLATEENEWEDSDPKAIYVWFKDQFDDYTRSRARRLIRYLKAWASLKFRSIGSRPSSVLLTILVADAVIELGDDVPGSEDEALEKIIESISSRVGEGQDVPNPVDENENLASRLDVDEWRIFVKKLDAFLTSAKLAIQSTDEVSACWQWSIAFEHLFPLPEPDVLDEQVEKHLPVLRLIPEVNVTAVQRNNTTMRYSGTNSVGPIPKNCNISFRVNNFRIFPVGTEFHWMVRNEGEEAEEANDLGHRRDIGIVATEHSAYFGIHYMDCVAISCNRVIGMRRVRVLISGAPAPRRHPPPNQRGQDIEEGYRRNQNPFG